MADAAVRRVTHDTAKKTSVERTSATADAVTPAGKVNSLKKAAVSSDRVTRSPVVIEAIAPAGVAPSQLSPIASAGTSAEANSPHPKIPRKATIVPENCATSAARRAMAAV